LKSFLRIAPGDPLLRRQPIRSFLPRSITAYLALVVFSTSILAAPGITARYDPDKPNRETAMFWLAYLLGRMAYHEEHHLPIPGAGEIIPTLEEEVSGRRMAVGAYRDFKKKEGRHQDAYWETMSIVEAAGFLTPYVWTFHRRLEWSSSKQPRNIAAFDIWRCSALTRHKPQTFGWLEGNKGYG